MAVGISETLTCSMQCARVAATWKFADPTSGTGRAEVEEELRAIQHHQTSVKSVDIAYGRRFAVPVDVENFGRPPGLGAGLGGSMEL